MNDKANEPEIVKMPRPTGKWEAVVKTIAALKPDEALVLPVDDKQASHLVMARESAKRAGLSITSRTIDGRIYIWRCVSED